MRIRRNDIILIFGLLALAGIIWTAVQMTRQAGAYAVVKVSGTEVARYPLNEKTTVRLAGAAGYNILVIDGESACISEASCPDKLCVRQGKIHYSGETIVCLPNKLVVEIVGNKKSGIDAVS